MDCSLIKIVHRLVRKQWNFNAANRSIFNNGVRTEIVIVKNGVVCLNLDVHHCERKFVKTFRETARAKQLKNAA